MFLKWSLAVVLLFCAGIALAQPDPKKPEPLVTKMYSIQSLIGDRGKATGVAVPDMDAAIKLLLETLPQFHELKRGGEGRQIIEREGGKLEIRATAKDHGEVKDLFEALERLQTVAVDVKVEVIELDAAAYEKLVQALPKASQGKPPLLLATGEEIEGKEGPAINKALEDVNRILKTGRVVQTSSDRFVNGVETVLTARQTVLTFHNLVVSKKAAGQPQFVKEGFKLVGLPVVSGDRRFIRFKLTEQSTVLTRIRKVGEGEAVANQNVVVQSADTEDLGATASAVVADGGTVLFKLEYGAKDKVWVVILRPSVFIQAEDDIRNAEKGKKE